MFKVLKKDFLRDPALEMELDLDGKTDEIELFGKKYRMYSDEWKHHVHLKCTNKCDADCAFCIERDSRRDWEDGALHVRSAELTIAQLKSQGMFRTLSVTGGEPTIFGGIRSLVELANKYRPTLFSVNSNGYGMLTAFADDTFDGWFNLSKHSVVDDGVFRRSLNVTTGIVREFKSRQPRARVRAQCVLGVSPRVRTISDIWDFIGFFRQSVDNFSFRNLIIQDAQGSVHPLFRELRNTLLDDRCCIEQAIQDYYVYETYERDGVNITLSWSNMELLRQYNESHQDSNFLEEIIVHPDGMVTGSWNKKSLVIFDAKELDRRTLRAHSGEPAEGQVSVAPKCVSCGHVSHCRHGWGGCDRGGGGCDRGGGGC